MTQQNNIIIITDSRTHAEIEAFYPMAAHLSQQSSVASVLVADRALMDNYDFFEGHNPNVSQLVVREVDGDYNYYNGEAQDKYPLKTVGIDEFDTIWTRMDHPVTDEFLAYLRDTFQNKHGKFVCHDPDGIMKTASKRFLAEIKDDMGDLMPDVKLCETARDVQAFQKAHPNGAVLKQLKSHGGKGVVRYNPNDPDNSDLNTQRDIEKFLEEAGPCLAMEFLQPEVQSDNRIIVMNGEIIGAIQRTPGKDGWQCNLSSGGKFEGTEVSEREHDIVRHLNPYMRENGIFIYGVDALLNDNGERVLSEVNTANVGGITPLEQVSGTPYTLFVAQDFAKAAQNRTLKVQTKPIAERRLDKPAPN